MKILIIDDDPEEFELFQAAMEDLPEKISMSEAHTCSEAEVILKEKDIDFIIIDLNLGTESGIACLRQLRSGKLAGTIPIVMYSSAQTKKYVDECFEAKANFFFVKPNSIAQLTYIIDKLIIMNWLEHAHITRENFVLSA